MTTFKIFKNKTDLTYEQIQAHQGLGRSHRDMQRVTTPTNFGMPR